MRGENVVFDCDFYAWLGSSPHARGKLGADVKSHDESRLIPACAGKTPNTSSTNPGTSAHPRMRGENERCYTVADVLTGSSPHARGKHCVS